MRHLYFFLPAVACALLRQPLPAGADEIRFANPRDWRAWQLPGTVELTPRPRGGPHGRRRSRTTHRLSSRRAAQRAVRGRTS